MKLTDRVMLLLDYELEEKSAKLKGKMFYLSKTPINGTWKLFPIFKANNSTEIIGLQIAHKVGANSYGSYGEW